MSVSRASSGYRPGLAAVLSLTLMGALWLAGGASRGDEAGQIIVRATATIVLIVATLAGPRPRLAAIRPVLLLLGAILALVALHLVPLPPGVWQALPGRGILTQAIQEATAQPWRPLAIVPGAAVNALGSLIVPVAVVALFSIASPDDRQYLPAALLAMIVAAALLGLLQFIGAGFDNPLINETVGMVGGNFANRNHFALFLAVGLLLVPGWVFSGRGAPMWRIAAGGGLMLLLALVTLATGSRAGLGLAAIAVVIGLAAGYDGLRRAARRMPRWLLPAALAGFVALLAAAILASVAANRASAIDRLFAVDIGQDMRGRGRPVVLDMIREYLPVGSGVGGFDPIFRMHEPFELLKLTYFNHAHNDFLEITLDTGLPGLLLLAAAVVWWGVASIKVWRVKPSFDVTLGRIGSGMLLLVLAASAFDYPARTPMIMAVIVIGAALLSTSASALGRSALPADARHL